MGTNQGSDRPRPGRDSPDRGPAGRGAGSKPVYGWIRHLPGVFCLVCHSAAGAGGQGAFSRDFSPEKLDRVLNTAYTSLGHTGRERSFAISLRRSWIAATMRNFNTMKRLVSMSRMFDEIDVSMTLLWWLVLRQRHIVMNRSIPAGRLTWRNAEGFTVRAVIVRTVTAVDCRQSTVVRRACRLPCAGRASRRLQLFSCPL